MRILIIEGIATSGKSTIIEKLKRAFEDSELAIYSESDTHIPIMDKPSELHIAFFQSLVSNSIKTGAELVIFDRLYLTQAFRANATLDDYKTIEDILMQYSALTMFLKVEENVIAERVRLATLHREESWGEYVKTKGTTFPEIADYYINQQRTQLELLKESRLKYVIFNTSNHEYDQIVQELRKSLFS